MAYSWVVVDYEAGGDPLPGRSVLFHDHKVPASESLDRFPGEGGWGLADVTRRSVPAVIRTDTSVVSAGPAPDGGSTSMPRTRSAVNSSAFSAAVTHPVGAGVHPLHLERVQADVHVLTAEALAHVTAPVVHRHRPAAVHPPDQHVSGQVPQHRAPGPTPPPPPRRGRPAPSAPARGTPPSGCGPRRWGTARAGCGPARPAAAATRPRRGRSPARPTACPCPATARPRRCPGAAAAGSRSTPTPRPISHKARSVGSSPLEPQGAPLSTRTRRAAPSGRTPRAAAPGWPPRGRRSTARGGKTAVCSTAPVNSSATRSQETLVPSPRAISSAASTSQISWGAAARPAAASGRRPGGAGPSPARRNHRWRVRSAGRGRTPCAEIDPDQAGAPGGVLAAQEHSRRVGGVIRRRGRDGAAA